MQKINVKQLVTAAVFAALVCIATMLIPIKLPGGGFANLGDCFVIASGCLLGTPLGVLAAAIGSALADILFGYFIYAPATFIIKGLMAFTAYIIYKKQKTVLSVVLAALCSEIIMVVLYFVYECFILGFGAASADIIGNCGQGIVGIIAGVIIMTVIGRNTFLNKLFRAE